MPWNFWLNREDQWLAGLESQLPPQFARHMSDLVELLMRPNRDGGASMTGKAARDTVVRESYLVLAELRQSAALSPEEVKPDILFMHVCARVYRRDTSSKTRFKIPLDRSIFSCPRS